MKNLLILERKENRNKKEDLLLPLLLITQNRQFTAKKLILTFTV
jgi:hypothetical protein